MAAVLAPEAMGDPHEARPAHGMATLVLLAAPLAAGAQSSDKIHRIGVLRADEVINDRWRDPDCLPQERAGAVAEESEAEMSETVSVVQIVTAVTQPGALLYGLTASGCTNTTSAEKCGFLCR